VNVTLLPDDIEGIMAKDGDHFSISIGCTKLSKNKITKSSKKPPKYEPKEKARKVGMSASTSTSSGGALSNMGSSSNSILGALKDKEKRRRSISLGPDANADVP